MESDFCTFFGPLGRITGYTIVTRSPSGSPDAEDPNNQVIEPHHRGKYGEPNRDERRGIADCIVLLGRKLWVERILGNGPSVHGHDDIL